MLYTLPVKRFMDEDTAYGKHLFARLTRGYKDTWL